MSAVCVTSYVYHLYTCIPRGPPERAVPVAAEVPNAEVVGHDEDKVGPRGVACAAHAAHAEQHQQEEESEGRGRRHRPGGEDATA